MQPFYQFQTYNPFFYYYPSIYPFAQTCAVPSFRPSVWTQNAYQAIQPKTTAIDSSISIRNNRKEKESVILCREQKQKLVKNYEKKSSKKSIVDNIELQNRNILPNMTNVILSYIRRVNKSGKEVKKVLQAYHIQDLQQTLRKFYAYQNYLKNNVNDFIIRNGIRALMNRRELTCPCFSIQEQVLFSKIFRIVILRYLDKDYLEFILCSKKMDQSKRKDHLKVRRYLIETLKCLVNDIQDLSQ